MITISTFLGFTEPIFKGSLDALLSKRIHRGPIHDIDSIFLKHHYLQDIHRRPIHKNQVSSFQYINYRVSWVAKFNSEVISTIIPIQKAPHGTTTWTHVFNFLCIFQVTVSCRAFWVGFAYEMTPEMSSATRETLCLMSLMSTCSNSIFQG